MLVSTAFYVFFEDVPELYFLFRLIEHLFSNGKAHVHGDGVNRARKLRYKLDKLIIKSYKSNAVIKTLNMVYMIWV